MARSTYHDQFSKLISKGYLVHSHGNTYNFYEVPPSATHTHDSPSSEGLDFESNPIDDIPLSIAGQEKPQEGIEINNKQDTPHTQPKNIHTEEVGGGQKAAAKEVRITDLLTNGQAILQRARKWGLCFNMATYTENVYDWLKRKGLGAKYECAGVYCIKIDHRIVYIGKSANMLRRIA